MHRGVPQEHRAQAGFGEAYWSLANLKTFRFRPADMCACGPARPAALTTRTACIFISRSEKPARTPATTSRPSSITPRATGSGARSSPTRPRSPPSASRRQGAVHASVLRSSPATVAPAPDPIFIVGMPRAGSTLLEQILSSHSAVEGTMELPDIGTIARELGGRSAGPRKSGLPGDPRTPRAPANCVRWASATSSDAHPAQDDRPVLHRQDAEQLAAHRADPADAAQREDHRRPSPPDQLLLFGLQAALRARSEFRYSLDGPRPLSTVTTWN